MYEGFMKFFVIFFITFSWVGELCAEEKVYGANSISSRERLVNHGEIDYRFREFCEV